VGLIYEDSHYVPQHLEEPVLTIHVGTSTLKTPALGGGASLM
jgi:hypothetical protein